MDIVKSLAHQITLLGLLLPFTANTAPLMYVPSGNANDLVIIDLNTDTIVGRIPELENAHGLSTSSNSEYLVAGSMLTSGTKQNKGAVKPAAVSEAEHAAHHGDSSGNGMGQKRMKKTSASYISIVHPKHGHVMRRIEVQGLTHHTAVSPDGKTAIAVHSGAGGISVINLDKMEVTNTLKTGLWPNYAVFTNQGNRLYVSNARPGTISEIDTKQWKVIREHKVGKEPEHMAFAPKSQKLFVANKGDGSVSIIDISSGKVDKTYSTGKNIHGVDVSADENWLFTANMGNNTITRINLTTGKKKVVELSPAPYHLTYAAIVNKVYVSSRRQPKIWVIDPDTLNIKKEISIGKGVAHQMVIK